MKKRKTVIAAPPGATIEELLPDSGMSLKEFAARMEMPEKRCVKLLNGDIRLTDNIAKRLESVFGLPTSFWCNLEAIYRGKLLEEEI